MSKDQIRIDLDLLSSEELLDIWNSNDHKKYKPEAFSIIKEILTERGVVIPLEKLVNSVNSRSIQSDFDRNSEKVNRSSIAAYFAFEVLISASLIRFTYFIGMILITLLGYNLAVKSQSTIGAAILVFGNLIWRIVCEASIIFFRIHESLASIDKKL
jgi:hypothetical protein